MVYQRGAVVSCGVSENDAFIETVPQPLADLVVIEMVANQGKIVGRTTFETCFWVGRFFDRWRERRVPVLRVYRNEVKRHLLGRVKGGDKDILSAIVRRYGGRAAAVGTKVAPGPLYHVKTHMWSALAIALVSSDKARLVVSRDGHAEWSQ